MGFMGKGEPRETFASFVLRDDDRLSEGYDKWLTCVKRETYLLHIKDTHVDFEKRAG